MKHWMRGFILRIQPHGSGRLDLTHEFSHGTVRWLYIEHQPGVPIDLVVADNKFQDVPATHFDNDTKGIGIRWKKDPGEPFVLDAFNNNDHTVTLNGVFYLTDSLDDL